MAPVPGGMRRALHGFSGVDLTLIEYAEGSVVRKQARRPEQNARLRAQAEKLAWAHRAGFPCPALLGSGSEGGLCWFDMDYVPGESLANGLISGRAIDWPQVVDQVRLVLLRLRDQAAGFIPAQAFQRKLAEIEARCAAQPVLRPLAPRIGRAIGALRALDWSWLPDGPSHGDLTLENMLLRSDGSVLLIDFDVPAPGSYMLDIGKIYQDLSGQWFLRQLALRDPAGVDLLNARLNLARAARQFDTALQAMVPAAVPDGEWRGRIAQLAAYHLMRTLPYAVDARVPGFVLTRVETCLRM